MLLLLLPALAGSDEAFPEMQGCLEAGDHTQFAINLCSGRRARVHMHQLKMLEERIGWKGDRSAFDKAVLAFDDFLTERCRYLGSFWKGGSGQPMIINGCGSQTRAGRSKRLVALLEGTKGGVRPLQEADTELNTVWSAKAKGDDGMLAVQRKWLAYRDAQCTWEESVLEGSRDACLSALTDERIAQIHADVER